MRTILTLEEAAALLEVSKAAVLCGVRDGKLQPHRIFRLKVRGAVRETPHYFFTRKGLGLRTPEHRRRKDVWWTERIRQECKTHTLRCFIGWRWSTRSRCLLPDRDRVLIEGKKVHLRLAEAPHKLKNFRVPSVQVSTGRPVLEDEFLLVLVRDPAAAFVISGPLKKNLVLLLHTERYRYQRCGTRTPSQSQWAEYLGAWELFRGRKRGSERRKHCV